MVWLSLAGAVGTVAVMERWTGTTGLRCRWLGAIFLCTTWLFAREAVLGGPAMAGVFFSVLSLYNFFLTFTISRHRAWFPVWLFGAMLCGGAAALAAPLTAIAGFLLQKRRWREVRRWIDVREVLVFCVLCLVWFYFRWDGGTIFTPAPHGHLFWYPTRLLRDLLPWTPLYLTVITIGIWKGKLRSDGVRFMLTCIWATIVGMSLIASKSESYLLPIYPFFAYLTAALLKKKKR